MKSTIPIFLLLAFLFPMMTQAAPQDVEAPEPPGETEIEPEIDPSDEMIPEREIQFEHTEAEHQLKLFRADPKLLEQKYSAVVRFEFAEDPKSGYLSLVPPDLRDILNYGGMPLFRIPASRTPLSPEDFFRRLMERLPDEKTPSGETVEFFTGEEPGAGYVQLNVAHAPSSLEFRILAPTAELAQQRAEALVKLLDYGLTQPIQSRLRHEKRQLQEEVTGYEERIEEAQERVAEYQQQLQDTESISAEELSALKTQQRLLAVDLAGTKARIQAADKLLSDRRPLSETRIDRIENVKITAEIELAGLSGRQKTLNEMIEQAEQRLELVGKMRDASVQIRRAEVKKSEVNKRIRIFNEAVELFGPLPLHEGKIVIQPIQWGG